MSEPLSITIVGTGYVGLVSGTCLAAKGHSVRVLDTQREIVDSINRGVPTIHETGLPELLADVVARGRLVADLASAETIGDADVVLLDDCGHVAQMEHPDLVADLWSGKFAPVSVPAE